VRISPPGNASGDWISGPLMPPLWKRCDSFKVPMTVLAPGHAHARGGATDREVSVTHIVIDHWRIRRSIRPDQLNLLMALKRYPKVFS